MASLTKKKGRVVKLLEEGSAVSTLVIDIGSEHGLPKGAEVVVYVLGEEIVDPETNESLGKLEIVRGTGTVEHVQTRMAIVKGATTKVRKRVVKSPFQPFWAGQEEILENVEEPAYFVDVQVGDLVRVIKLP